MDTIGITVILIVICMIIGVTLYFFVFNPKKVEVKVEVEGEDEGDEGVGGVEGEDEGDEGVGGVGGVEVGEDDDNQKSLIQNVIDTLPPGPRDTVNNILTSKLPKKLKRRVRNILENDKTTIQEKIDLLRKFFKVLNTMRKFSKKRN